MAERSIRLMSKQKHGEDDFDIVCAEDYWPLIPDAAYEAQPLRYNYKSYGKTKKLFLHFRITSMGEHLGKEIFMVFNMPTDGKLRLGHKYYKTWVLVNAWKIPSRNTRMSPRLFLNKSYKIKTRTVKPKHNDKEMPSDFCYSVVDQILEVTTNEEPPF
jgi:hypothetical protein